MPDAGFGFETAIPQDASSAGAPGQKKAPHHLLLEAATPAALATAAALPYLNSLANGFAYDDLTQVLGNPYLRSFHFLPQIFSTSVWSFLGGAGGVTNNYRPVMTLGYLACYQLFGPSAVAFHTINLLVNGTVVLLVYKVGARLFNDRSLGLLAAVIFALHPVHSESVDWVGGVTDLELTLFCLAAFLFYLWLPRFSGARANWLGLQAALVASLALALLSKESAITLPPLLSVFEHFYRDDRGQTRWTEKLARYAPAWLLVPVYLALRIHFLGGFAPELQGRSSLSPDAVVLSAAALLGQYAAKFCWPARLCLYYVFPAGWSNLLPEVLGGIATISAVALLFVVLWRAGRRVSFGLIWFLVTLAPVLNVRWMPDAAFAERYLYLPSVGLCWVAAWAARWLWHSPSRLGHGRRVALAAAAAVVAMLAVARIVTRNRDWKNNVVLYRRTLEVSPNSYVIHDDLGETYWQLGERDLAAREWYTAAKLAPDAVLVLDNLGLLDISEHRYDDALAELGRAISLAPHDVGAHVDLGMAYGAMGRAYDAEREFESAVALAPLNSFAHKQLAQQYFDDGRYADADAQFRASLALRPDVSAWLGLGLSRWRQGDTSEAEGDFLRAKGLVPSDPRPHFILGLFYRARRRFPEALDQYQIGLRFDPSNQQALDAVQKLQAEISHADSKGAVAP
jgi:protein O-mannosyl-transferase